jgi:hypothetical protein
MQFSYLPRIREHLAVEAPIFQIERLWAHRDGSATDLSDFIDCSYDYHSSRELKWHLAERFGLPVRAVALRGH